MSSRNPRSTGQRDGRRRLFTKLLKDKSAVVRNKHDAVRFVDGMQTFEDKMELLSKLDDNRDLGRTRICECLSFIGSIDDVERLFIRLLGQVMTDETSRPMFVRLRNRILIQIFSVPMLMETLVALEAAAKLSTSSLRVLSSFLMAVSSSFIEARRNDFVMEMAKQLKNLESIDTRSLCSLVLVEPGLVTTHRTKVAKQSLSVSWVTDLREPGGRHDNDHLNFRNIRILPTANELRSEVRSWLPLSSGENNFVSDPVTCLIGNNFRLLREDAILTMKQRIHERRRLWRNARIVDLDISVRDGTVSFVVQCDPKGNRPNWEFSRSLAHGTVVALCADDTPALVGSITIRKVDSNWLKAPDGPKLGVRFDVDGGDFNKALDSFIHNSSCGGKSRADKISDQSLKEKEQPQVTALLPSFDLIESSSSFATYQPILKSLQETTSLPFVDEICHMRPPSTTAPLEYLPTEIRMPHDITGVDHIVDIRSATVNDFLEGTTLDTSQARALHHALTSRVSLIQGPPGTGAYR
jgi:hypothetical protein